MSTKADCQAAMTTAEAAWVKVQRQADDKQTNGKDTLKSDMTTLATALTDVRTQIEGLP